MACNSSVNVSGWGFTKQGAINDCIGNAYLTCQQQPGCDGLGQNFGMSTYWSWGTWKATGYFDCVNLGGGGDPDDEDPHPEFKTGVRAAGDGRGVSTTGHADRN